MTARDRLGVDGGHAEALVAGCELLRAALGVDEQEPALRQPRNGVRTEQGLVEHEHVVGLVDLVAIRHLRVRNPRVGADGSARALSRVATGGE